MSDTLVREVAVVNEAGLHARPSHMIVKLAQEFDAEIHLCCDGRRAHAASILSVMTLGAVRGTTIRIEADGPNASSAVQALESLIASGFEEDS